MVLLPLLLFLWPWGALAASPPLPEGSLTFRLLKTTVFHNASSTASEGLALLGDLETHSLDYGTGGIRFHQPWAQKGMTPKQWQDLETLIRHHMSKFNLLMNKVAKDEGEHYPFVTQVSFGCELHPNGTSRIFCDTAMNGEDFISLNVDTGTWIAQQGNKLALSTRDIIKSDKSTSMTVLFLLKTTCVNEIKSFVQDGKESLERQEHPIATLFAKVPPPVGTPAWLLLVCWATGFYPRPIRVAWLQDGEEVAPGWHLNSTGILPNGDLTYQLRSSLAVELDDGHSYACRVDHSSLGGHSLLIPWGTRRSWVPGLVTGIILVGLAIAVVAVVLWWRRRRIHQDVGRAEYRAWGAAPGRVQGSAPLFLGT